MIGLMWTRNDGVKVATREDHFPEPIRLRLIERRRIRPMWVYQIGVATGLFLGSVGTALAQGEKWTEPSTVFSLGGLLVSVGVAYNLLQDSRKRIDKLEEHSATKESVNDMKSQMTDRFDRIEDKLDRMLSK